MGYQNGPQLKADRLLWNRVTVSLKASLEDSVLSVNGLQNSSSGPEIRLLAWKIALQWARVIFTKNYWQISLIWKQNTEV